MHANRKGRRTINRYFPLETANSLACLLVYTKKERKIMQPQTRAFLIEHRSMDD
jgi:hypothetical protein